MAKQVSDGECEAQLMALALALSARFNRFGHLLKADLDKALGTVGGTISASAFDLQIPPKAKVVSLWHRHEIHVDLLRVNSGNDVVTNEGVRLLSNVLKNHGWLMWKVVEQIHLHHKMPLGLSIAPCRQPRMILVKDGENRRYWSICIGVVTKESAELKAA
jgi:hypothetical protein